jgi:general secretion pathway protein K
MARVRKLGFIKRTTFRSTGSDTGAALILALLMISILIVLVLETLRAAQVEEGGVRFFQDSLQAEALAKSGVNLVVAALVQDLEDNEVDHPGETWALALEPDNLPAPLGDWGALEGEVLDETGKFPINSLVDENNTLRLPLKQVLENLLTSAPFSLEVEEAESLIFAFKDWLDNDSETSGEFGAETDHYDNLESGYQCRNGPLNTLAELQLIRGVTPSLYYGEDGNPGLKDLLTVHGDGMININTAGPLILQALVGPAVSRDTAASWAENVIDYRTEPLHWDFLEESDWYRNRMAGYNDINVQAELITVRSSHFAVKIRGKVGVGNKSVFAYLERKKSAHEGQEQVSVTVKFWQVI